LPGAIPRLEGFYSIPFSSSFPYPESANFLKTAN
jgi:hypothetical protein